MCNGFKVKKAKPKDKRKKMNETSRLSSFSLSAFQLRGRIISNRLNRITGINIPHVYKRVVIYFVKYSKQTASWKRSDAIPKSDLVSPSKSTNSRIICKIGRIYTYDCCHTHIHRNAFTFLFCFFLSKRK